MNKLNRIKYVIPKNIGIVKLSSIFNGISSKAVVKNNVIVAITNSAFVSVIFGVSKTIIIPETKYLSAECGKGVTENKHQH